MTVQRVDQAIVLDGVCPVEDAELLMLELQTDVHVIDWSGCTHLHTACLQVLLAAGLPVRGTPANSTLARCIAPLFHQAATSREQIDA